MKYPFCTYTGHVFDMENMKPEDVRIEDIANALNKICRFAGNLDQFYSVAQHSIRVAWIVPKEYRLVALLHDATEAYIGDIPKPFKIRVPEIEAAEQQVWNIIARRFNLHIKIPDIVKQADHALLQLECQERRPELDLGEFPYTVPPTTPAHDCTVSMFLHMFRSLGGK